MSKFVLMLAVLSLAGCAASEKPSPEGKTLPEPAAFAHWPSVTEHPVPVDMALWLFCDAPSPERVEAARKEHGPHLGHTIVIRVSPDAAEAFRQSRPLPVGAVVVKQKYPDAAAEGPMAAYALMIKREAGFDAANGDWQYAYVSLGKESSVKEGRLQSCVECHSRAKDRDYLFRSYLGPAK